MRPDRGPDRESEFERELRDLGPRIEYPPTPDLARTVRHRLDEEANEETGSRTFWSRLPDLRWAAAAAAFVLIVAVPSLSPALRATVSDWFPAGGAGESGQAAGGGDPGPPPAESGGDVPESGGAIGSSAEPETRGARSLGKGLGLGERISLREARARASDGLLLPGTPELGEPDEVYTPGPSQENGVALVYRAGPGLPPLGDTNVGLVLTELPGRIEPAYLSGGAPAEAGLESVSVRDRQGYWIPPNHRTAPAVERTDGLPGSVLLWEREGLALRLETNLSKQESVRIAESLR
jgi:hypothetical protein